MNKEDFTYLLANPKQLTSSETETVGELVARFPYFQAARAIYLKGLKSKQSFKYNQELKITAAYTTDRSILFDYITSDAFNQNEISALIKQNTDLLKDIEVNDADDISVNKNVLIDHSLNQYMKDNEGVLDPDLFEQKKSEENQITSDKKTPLIAVDVAHIETSPEEQLQIGKPLDFSKNETHSFTEWLKITTFKPIDRSLKDTPKQLEESPKVETEIAKPANALEKKLDIIDKFISLNPKISPIKDISSSGNLAQTKLVQNDSLMTETLARIYLEQKNYEKAIQSYRILILKYPEKSSFFADQIKAVKQLQENNTK